MILRLEKITINVHCWNRLAVNAWGLNHITHKNILFHFTHDDKDFKFLVS